MSERQIPAGSQERVKRPGERTSELDAGRRAASPAPGQPSSEGKIRASNLLARVGSLTQLALLLPAATVAGWAIGLGLDAWLKQHWIYIAGLLLGASAGFVQIFRTVLALDKDE